MYLSTIRSFFANEIDSQSCRDPRMVDSSKSARPFSGSFFCCCMPANWPGIGNSVQHCIQIIHWTALSKVCWLAIHSVPRVCVRFRACHELPQPYGFEGSLGKGTRPFGALGVWSACLILVSRKYRMTNVGYNNSLAWKTLKEGNSATKPALGVTSCDVVVLQPYVYIRTYVYI